MPEVKKAVEVAAEAIAVPDKSKYEYVTIPDKDLFDQPHPGIGLNLLQFGPGTHLVSPDVAYTLKERLTKFNRQQIRLLQPGRDMIALAVMERSGSNVGVVPEQH